MAEVSAAGAGRIIGVSDQTVRRYITADHLNARREGFDKTWWVDLEDLRSFARKYNYRFNEDLAEQLARK